MIEVPERVQMEPQAPRKVAVAAIGPNWVELSWAAPILDGGTRVYEYEIAYSLSLIHI